MAQDEIYAHGMNIYLKSVLESTPTYSVVNSLLEKALELNAAPGNEIDHGYMWELLPSHTVLTRSEDSTSHVRSSRHTTGCVLKWVKNSPGVQRAAKHAAHELTDIVAKAEAQASGMGLESNTGYGNYSERSLEFVAFLAPHTTQIVFHRFRQPCTRGPWFVGRFERACTLRSQLPPAAAPESAVRSREYLL
jgi:hypothetical protein